MGAGVDPGASDSCRENDLQSYTSGRAAAPGTAGHIDHNIVTMTRDTKRTYRTIRGGKTSEVRPEGSKLENAEFACTHFSRSLSSVAVVVEIGGYCVV